MDMTEGKRRRSEGCVESTLRERASSSQQRLLRSPVCAWGPIGACCSAHGREALVTWQQLAAPAGGAAAAAPLCCPFCSKAIISVLAVHAVAQ